MKATGIISLACIFAAGGLAYGLMLERHAGQKLAAQNDELRRQLGQMTGLAGENQRLVSLLARANAPGTNADGTVSTNGPTDARVAELAKLRGQVEAFQQQSNEVASLRADTRATQDELKAVHQAQLASQVPHRDPSVTNGAPFQILEADYGTKDTNMDVIDALNDRIRGGSLKIIASNKLNGDPQFGQVKNLTVVYRFNGAVFTNQFREGAVVVLPPEDTPATP